MHDQDTRPIRSGSNIVGNAAEKRMGADCKTRLLDVGSEAALRPSLAQQHALYTRSFASVARHIPVNLLRSP
ncbi:hypothetical protein BaRGS_00031867 [Batillaria attramentaria]|uniref:Uncharacterized protein n=1 Tax=Batillaria attramentaria TaxID=370345 RepID=A0ABD0JQ29_9CAEN